MTQITKEEQIKLIDLLLKFDAMGESNAMVRLRFDKPRKKDWKEFMKEHLDIVSLRKKQNN